MMIMDTASARILARLNTAFYREQSVAFSASRQAPWAGWRRCLQETNNFGIKAVEKPQNCSSTPFSVFDLACGNLRFEAFLQVELPLVDFNFHTLDNCDGLVASCGNSANLASHQHLDVLAALFSGCSLSSQIMAPACDLSVAFGFMHHLPLPEQRAEVLHSLVQQTKPGGYIVASFWCFAADPAFLSKSQPSQDAAIGELGLKAGCLADGDYLLGWQGKAGVYRYCHSFND
ncbi:MAG: class I SAM-dependent methyltransferase, partial [Coriobacteriales bacterium]|nr:class I SAM-dependent methyltransferase [Coriobacteriales bacterium]